MFAGESGDSDDLQPESTTHQLRDLSHLLLQHVLHAPVRRHGRNVKQEVAQQVRPPQRVLHLPQQVLWWTFEGLNSSLPNSSHPIEHAAATTAGWRANRGFCWTLALPSVLHCMGPEKSRWSLNDCLSNVIEMAGSDGQLRP